MRRHRRKWDVWLFEQILAFAFFSAQRHIYGACVRLSSLALKFATNFVVLQAILRQVWTYFWMLYDLEGKTDGWRREVGASTASVKRSGVFLLHLGVLGGHVV